jgi:hypothetical protein
MHDTTIKIIDAQQAKLRNSYKNTKLNLLKTNAAIRFNKICRIKHLKPNYINIKINGKELQDRSECIDVLIVNFYSASDLTSQRTVCLNYKDNGEAS